MRLPNRHLAHVPEMKITHYLLNLNHPRGKGKAQAFRGRGYDESNVIVFIRDLVAIAQTYPVSEVRQLPNGVHYVVYGEIPTPVGGMMLVRTIWRIDTGENAPRLISAFPRLTIEQESQK